ncbi:hypothetical protein CSHISOI_02695 [Colletotrichum shisoi]|uniref:Uncharacterized protein n=1 Tax=Colletotrichum shisoi TaxID=2078593 RepID=A0A5Q4C2I8_9PEZI|nr:hypothetical protein CSHISOI_02695 [Colletotrichum shisoi]
MHTPRRTIPFFLAPRHHQCSFLGKNNNVADIIQPRTATAQFFSPIPSTSGPWPLNLVGRLVKTSAAMPISCRLAMAAGCATTPRPTNCRDYLLLRPAQTDAISTTLPYHTFFFRTLGLALHVPPRT